MFQNPYKSTSQKPEEFFFTAKDIHATDGSRSAVTTALVEGRVLVTDPYAATRGETPGKSCTVMDINDTNWANAKYGFGVVVTDASPAKLTPGSNAQNFMGVTGGLAQALVQDDDDLAVGALLYINDDTGTLGNAPATALSGAADTVDEQLRIDTRPFAILLEAHTTDTVAVLRWVQILPQTTV